MSEQLVDSQRHIDMSLQQLSSFEDNCDQFQAWLSETGVKLKLEAEEKPSLQDKKLQIQNHKVRVYENVQFYVYRPRTNDCKITQ